MTNQMVSACKAYITNNGTDSLWSQPPDVVVEKILSAIKLKQVTVSLIIYLDKVSLFLCCFCRCVLNYSGMIMLFIAKKNSNSLLLRKLSVNKPSQKIYPLILS